MSPSQKIKAFELRWRECELWILVNIQWDMLKTKTCFIIVNTDAWMIDNRKFSWKIKRFGISIFNLKQKYQSVYRELFN
jgi:hypothetical protein